MIIEIVSGGEIMIVAGYVITIIYSLALLVVTIYCLMQFHLLYYYTKSAKSKHPSHIATGQLVPLPFVTIQLPIYNEIFVVKRLLASITALDYPKDLYEIHILDDSTDETKNLLEKLTEQYSKDGFNIKHIHRVDRQGYKAGALRDALPNSRGEYVAIFDADFLPYPSFLKDTLKYFEDPDVGVVQTRWDHINQTYSILTEVQAFQLNVHFTVEQLGRSAGDYFLQFNGTAGLWRKSCIGSSGGWEADTLTEDLDLSYRAQLKGWKIVYLESIISPAELPAEINGLKSQQYRWMKGGAETAKKVLPKIWQSNLATSKKLHASMHLLGSSVFVAVFILGIFSVPLSYLINPLGLNTAYYTIFLISLLSILIVYYVANVKVAWKKEPKLKMIFKFLVIFPIFLALSMGLSLHNTVAVIQGFIGKKTAFIRTPKFDIRHISDKIKRERYFSQQPGKITIGEGLLFLYFSYALYRGIFIGPSDFVIMHLLLCIGYGMIFYYSINSWSLQKN